MTKVQCSQCSKTEFEMPYIYLKSDNSDFGYFILTRQDLEANDWEVVE